MIDVPLDFFPPQRHVATVLTPAATVQIAHGLAVITWPSGRRTLEQFAGTNVITDAQMHRAPYPERWIEAGRIGLANTLRDFQERTLRHGYWIRHKRSRRKPRRVLSVEWVRPSEYKGSAPGIGGMIQ